MKTSEVIALIIIILLLLFLIYYFNIDNIRHYICPTSFTVDGATVTNYNNTANIQFQTTLPFKLIASPNSEYLMTVCNTTMKIETNIFGYASGVIRLSTPCVITLRGPGIKNVFKIIVGTLEFFIKVS